MCALTPSLGRITAVVGAASPHRIDGPHWMRFGGSACRSVALAIPQKLWGASLFIPKSRVGSQNIIAAHAERGEVFRPRRPGHITRLTWGDLRPWWFLAYTPPLAPRAGLGDPGRGGHVAEQVDNALAAVVRGLLRLSLNGASSVTAPLLQGNGFHEIPAKLPYASPRGANARAFQVLGRGFLMT